MGKNIVFPLPTSPSHSNLLCVMLKYSLIHGVIRKGCTVNNAYTGRLLATLGNAEFWFLSDGWWSPCQRGTRLLTVGIGDNLSDGGKKWFLSRGELTVCFSHPQDTRQPLFCVPKSKVWELLPLPQYRSFHCNNSNMSYSHLVKRHHRFRMHITAEE